jgi:hypothetical protein
MNQSRHSRGRRLISGTVALSFSLLPAVSVFPAIFCGNSVSAQTASIYLPQRHPAYETVEKLKGAGLLTDVWLNQRPLSRNVVADALKNGRDNARTRGMSLLAREADWRLREFIRDLSEPDPEITPLERPFSVYWEGEAGVDLTAEISAVVGIDNRKDLPPDFKGAVYGGGALELYGTAGNGIGYGARHRQTTELRKGTERTWIFSSGQNIPFRGATGDYVSYPESSGHLSWDGRVFGADLSFDSPAWGPSPSGNLILSGHTPSFGHVQGRVAFGDWLRYRVLFGSLRSGIIDSVRSYQPDEPTIFRALERQKYLIGHRFDVRLPYNLNFGFTEMGIAADRFPELLYMVPTVSVWDVQHSLNDPDNTMMGFDMSWSPQNGPYLYGGIALDELSVSEVFSDSTHHNWVAFQFGLNWTPSFSEGRWNLWIEATRVMPNVYRHKYPVNDWTHVDSWLGFWSAQNSEVVQGRLSCMVSPRLRMAAWGRYARKGGIVDRIEQYAIPPAEEFMMGMERIGAWVGASVTYEGLQHWQVTAEIVNAPRGLWPHSRAQEIIPPIPASLGQELQFNLRWTYNPF